MEKGKILIFTLIILFSINLTLALDTRLNFKTSPSYEIILRIMDSTGSTIPGGVYNFKTDSSGKTSLNFSSDTLSSIKLSITIRDSNGKNINYAEGDPVRIIRDIKTGYIYDIDLMPIVPVIVKGITIQEEKKQQADALAAATVPVINQTKNETASPAAAPTESANKSSSSFISGFSIASFTSGITSKIKWKFVLYFIIAIFVIAFIIFLIAAYKRRSSSSSNNLGIHIGPRNESFKVKSLPHTLTSAEERTLREAENKIRQAQSEINRIKNRNDLIREAEKRLEQDRYELERLKRRYWIEFM